MHASFQECIKQQLEEIRAADTCKSERILFFPLGKARARMQILAAHSSDDLESALEAISDGDNELGI